MTNQKHQSGAFELPDILNENFGIIEIFGIKIWLLKSVLGLSICMWNKKCSGYD